MTYPGRFTGFIIIALILALAAVPAGAETGEEKHMHGADGRHVAVGGAGGPSGSIILSHHDLMIKDSSGKVLDNCDIHSALLHKGESEPFHREHNVYEPENGVYGTHLTYTEPGEYKLVEWITMPDKSKVTVEFPVWVYPEEEEGRDDHGPSLPVTAGGIVLGVCVFSGTYLLGRKHGRSKTTLASLLISILILQPVSQVLAVKESHIHGEDGRHLVAPGASGGSGARFKAYPTKDKKESTTKEQDGYTFILSVENEEIKPDPEVVSIPDDAAKIIGLEVETVKTESTGSGINTTGQVVANPNGVVSVNTRVSGRVESVALTPGQKVAAGQTLFTISSPEIADAQAEMNRTRAEEAEAQASVRKAESGLQAAQMKLQTAKRVLARQKKLAQAGLFASAPVEETRAAVAKADGELREAKAALTHLESQEKRLDEGAKAGVVARRELEAAQSAAEQGRTRMATAGKHLELAQTALTREEQIQSQGLRDSREVHQAESDVELAEAGILSAKSELAQAKAGLTRAASALGSARGRLALFGVSPGNRSSISVTSPIAGVVKSRPVNAGEVVTSSQLLCEVLNISSIWIESDIFEKDLNQISLGQKVVIAADGASGKRFEGTISNIGSEVNHETRSVRVRTVVSNHGGVLKPNMYVRVAIAGTQSGTVSVSSPAIQDDGGIQVVFVEEAPGTYRRKPVRIGPVLGDRTMIDEGLKAGDKVVTQGSYQLIAKVKGG